MEVNPLTVGGSNSGPVGGSNESRQLHSRDDVDFDRSSHHHTIGIGPMQAASGAEFAELKARVDKMQTFLITLGYVP